jgi:hypothetical protein
MLLGLASLLLMACEERIASTCVYAPAFATTSARLKPWLSRVEGCACCLQRTRGVSECFFQVCAARAVRGGVG